MYGATTENLRKSIEIGIVGNEKDYLKQKPKPSYISHFDSTLVEIPDGIVVCTLNKAGYVGMFLFDLRKMLMCKSFIIIILKTNVLTTQDYYSQTLIFQCMKIKLKMFMKILVRIEIFHFINYLARSK